MKQSIVNVDSKVIEVRGTKVLLDCDVAALYGVETKRINEAVGNNPDKFPDGYIITVDNATKNELVENFDRFNTLKHSSAKPKAFTEKGLYMLATILKSPKATETTLELNLAVLNFKHTVRKKPSKKTTKRKRQ